MSELVTPGQRGVVKVLRKGVFELVQEMHVCDEWELILPEGRYRCGLVFGDGHRCDVTGPEVPGRSWSTRAYERASG